MTDSVDLAYAAGIIDGEGCILIIKHRKKRKRDDWYLRVVVRTADPIICPWMYTHFGGALRKTVKRQPNWRDGYVWEVNSRAAENFLRLILPYLTLKRPQADIALQFRATFKMSHPIFSPHLDETTQRRRELSDQLKEMRQVVGYH